MKSFLKKTSFPWTSFVGYFLLANSLVIASNIPLFMRFVNTQPSQVFNFSHIFWTHDYNLYLSAITQGKNGSWLYQDAFTTEETTAGVFYLFYIGIGKIASLFNLSSPLTYHLVRILLLELFFVLVYILSSLLVKKSLAFWAGVFIFLGTISPPFLFGYKLGFDLAIPWWTDFDTLGRLNTLPHYLAAYDLLLLSTFLAILYLRNFKTRYAAFSAISIFSAGIFFPAAVSPIGAAMPLSVFIFWLNRVVFGQKNFPLKSKAVLGLLLIIFSSYLSLIIIKWQEGRGFPWNIWTRENVVRWNLLEPNFNQNLIFLFGILPILALPALVSWLKSVKLENIFICCWTILPFLLLPLANQLSLPKLRLIEEVPFVPFGILATYSIFNIIPAFFKTKYLSQRVIKLMLLLIFFLSVIPVTFRVFGWRQEFAQTNFYSDLFYYSENELATIDFIQKNIPKGAVFLSDQRMGHSIPAHAPVFSYFGHMNLTYDFEAKEKRVQEFFSQSRKEEQAKEFLKENRISYVYFGNDEKTLSPGNLHYTFLQPIYQNSEIVLYEVKY